MLPPRPITNSRKAAKPLSFYFNVSSMKLLIEIQRVSNSPSKIRGGQGALMILNTEI